MRTRVGLVAGVLLSLAVLAILWGAEGTSAPRDEQVEKLIEQLGAEEYLAREAANQTLDTLGDRPLALLREAARDSKNPEIRWRATRLLTVPLRESRATGLKLVLIKEGEFRQGSAANQAGVRPDEAQHLVRITQPFYLGAQEVSQSEYQQVMKHNPSWFQATGGGKSKVQAMVTDRFPVERVSWYDALAFCNELSRLDNFQPYYQLDAVERTDGSIKNARVKLRGGHGYRLPTEAEWEYACRAGTVTPYHYGGVSYGHSANVKGQSIAGGYGGEIKGADLQRTCLGGNYRANAWGIYDMHGNVGEWCWDAYDKDYYATAPQKDPTGPDQSPHRVWRGGAWLLNEDSCRSASRNFQTPDERKDYVGFRVARNP